MKNNINFLVQGSVVLALVLGISLASLPTQVKAQDASQSGIQSKLKDLESEIASKAAQIKSQIGKKVENRLEVGLVQSKTDSQIILAALPDQSSTTNDYNPDANKNVTVIINKFTDYGYTGKVTRSINTDDFVVALGDLDDKSNLVAKRVVKEPLPDSTPIIYFWGKVTEASSSGMLVQGKDKNLNVSLNKDTSYQLGDKNSTSKSLEKDENVVAVGAIDAKTQYLIAQFIYIFPQTATPSPSASASAKLK